MEFDIAVVDGETATRRHLALALAPVGYRVVSYPDADSALAAILASPPRLVIAELLLPGPDGFELFQRVRSGVGERIELLCTSAVEWGQIDLAEVLARRFGARLLRKPFLKSELKALVHQLIGPGQPRQSSFSSEWRIGVEDANRVEDLAHDFELHIARVGLNRGRCSVRRPFECSVMVKTGGNWLQCGAKNISAGGLFLEAPMLTPEAWPRLDATLEISVDPGALGAVLRARARVAYQLSPEDAARQGVRPGFGLEFVDLSDQDQSALNDLIEALRSGNAAELRGGQSERPRAPVIWLLLVGLEANDLLRRPGFLHRQGIEVLSVVTMDAAVAFARDHLPALCVVHEGALGADPGSTLAPLAQAIPGQRIVLVGHTRLSSLVSAGLCAAVLRRDTPIELLLEEVRERLSVAQRRAPRVPAHAEVAVQGGPPECHANMVNLSTGGMLLRSSTTAPIGTRVTLTFDLPGATGIHCGAVVLRSEPDPRGSSFLWGLSFSDLDESTSQVLSRYVESHVHFRDYFNWLKGAYFDGRLDVDDRRQTADTIPPSPDQEDRRA